MTDIVLLLPSLALFGAAVLLLCLFVWTVSGMFPGEFRPPALRRPAGVALLFAAFLIAAALGAHAVLFAIERITWPAAVILGGLVLLASPFVHTALPRAIQDDAAGVACFAVGALLIHGLLALV